MMIFKRFTHSRSWTQLILLFSLSFSVLLSTQLQAQQLLQERQETVLDQIAAVVNEDVVMLSEVKTLAIQSKQAGGAQSSDQVLIKKALEAIIMEKVQLQRAKALGIVIDDAAVNEAMLSIATRNKLDLEQFRVALIREGHNYKKFRESIRDKLYINTLRKRQQQSTKPISEVEVDALIQAESPRLNKGVQYHLLDILVPAPNGTPVKLFNARLTQAQSLRKQILRQASQPSDALIKKMGAVQKDLGWQASESLSPAYIRTLSLMGVGELSNIVRDAQGFHMLKLIEQRGGERKITQHARVRHILIPADDPKARAKIIQLRHKILAGENFGQLAKAHSADKGSAVKGGELGMMEPSVFVPPFAKAVTSLPLNTLSQPIQTRFGWHILEVLERKESDQTREALKAQAQSLIGEEKNNDKLNAWLQGLRDEAFVEYRIDI